MLEDSRPKAAVVLIDTTRGVLCAWNRRFGGWALPGGKQEPGETIVQTAMRELKEETGLEMKLTEDDIVYIAKSPTSDRIVYVFDAPNDDEEFDPDTFVPMQHEDGTPVAWLIAEELVATSPFRDFYLKMFASVDCGEDDVNEARRRIYHYSLADQLMERFDSLIHRLDRVIDK